ncbi:MAG TPA: type II toxin-antitoxin system antitoxin SocA domain-containing protein [Prolixibacteraceae bacterium]
MRQFLSIYDGRSFTTFLFSPAEIETLEYITQKFKHTSAREIAEISHDEATWNFNIDGKKMIPYHYAFTLEPE